MTEHSPKGWRHWHSPAKAKKTSPPVVVRFTAASGEVWSIWDVTMSKFKHVRQTHCEPLATARVFVNGAGVKRSYRFKSREPRTLAPHDLERQLAEAQLI
jgi:hypothetical protein